MTEKIWFQFPGVEDASAIEDDLALAIFAAQCVHGRPQTRLQVRYLVTNDGERAVLEVGGPAGEMALREIRIGRSGRCGRSLPTGTRILPDRCLCEGCRACTGKPGKPCGQAGLTGDSVNSGLCRWCRAERQARD